MDSLPPGAILLAGAVLLPLLRGRGQQVALVALPVLSFAHLLMLNPGTSLEINAFGCQLTLVHVDRLSFIWGIVFHIAAVVGALFALHVKDTLQHVSALLYVGSAIAAVFAGDLITLFVYWELTAISSVFLIWASRNERAYRAGMRYLIVQVGSGVLLLSGIVLHYQATGSVDFRGPFFTSPDILSSFPFGEHALGPVLIFLAFGVKAAFPLLHNWLTDAYPEATPTGTVFLSAFTTKLAIYTLARSFPGVECLIWIGAVMTAFPIFFAVIENDLRRVLAYSLNNQLGFMVVGVGIGTALSLNGTVSHAFAHILYKSLLFMSMGAVLYRTGTVKGSELGGLYKSMPWTTGFCIIGAASISAFPLFSGFVTKSLIVTAVAEEHHTVVFLALLFASAGVFHHSGIKIPFFAFFAHDSGIRCKEAPWNMLLAMGITAALCILIGCFYAPLYDLLPFANGADQTVVQLPMDRSADSAAAAPYTGEHSPYTVDHVIPQFQLLMFSALAFTLLVRNGIYPPELASVNLDTDWAYRRAFPAAIARTRQVAGRIQQAGLLVFQALARQLLGAIRQLHGPAGALARTWSIGAMLTWSAVLLAAYLLLYYLS